MKFVKYFLVFILFTSFFACDDTPKQNDGTENIEDLKIEGPIMGSTVMPKEATVAKLPNIFEKIVKYNLAANYITIAGERKGKTNIFSTSMYSFLSILGPANDLKEINECVSISIVVKYFILNSGVNRLAHISGEGICHDASKYNKLAQEIKESPSAGVFVYLDEYSNNVYIFITYYDYDVSGNKIPTFQGALKVKAEIVK